MPSWTDTAARLWSKASSARAAPSRFACLLPPSTKIAPATTVATPSPSMPQIAPGAQILVVDDSSQVREVLRELLDRYGHTVVCCEDGESGLVELETRK